MSETKRPDTMYRIGFCLLAGTGFYTAFLWWTWLVNHMGAPANTGQKAILAAVIFIPMALFVWLMVRLIRPSPTS